MPKKIIYHSIFAILLLILSLFFYFNFVKNQDEQKFVKQFENHLHQQEREIKEIFNDTHFLADVLNKTPNISYGDKNLKKLEAISKKSYHFSIFKDDSLVLWSNNKVEIPKKYISHIPQSVNLSNGLYQTITQELEIPQIGKLKAIGLIPIRHHYKSESKHLNSYLAINDKFPSNIKISDEQTPYEIVSTTGSHLCYLAFDGEVIDSNRLMVSFFFFLFALLFNIYAVNLIANHIKVKNFKWASLYLLVSILFMLGIFFYIDFEHKFNSFKLFQSISNNKHFYFSYAAIILILSFGMWLLLFVLENFKISFTPKNQKLFLFNGVLLSVAIVITVILTMHGFKSLILYSNQEFNFYKSIQFAIDNPLGLITIILITMFQFVMSIVLMNMIKAFNHGIKTRYTIYGISTLVVLLLNSWTGLNMVLLILVPYIAILFIALDLYISEHRKRFLKTVWLIGLPVITTFILIKFHTDKETLLKESYAKILADDTDNIAEKAFYNLKSKIEEDHTFSNLTSDTITEYSVLKEKMDEIFSESGYLINYYNFDFFVFDDKAKPLIKHQKSKQSTLFNIFRNKSTKTHFSDIKLYKDPNNAKSYYLMRLVTGKSQNNPKEIFINLYKNKHPSSKIYTELLAPKKFKGLDYLDRYDYAIYNSKGLVYKSDDSFSSSFDYKKAPPVGTSIQTNIGKEAATIYQNNNKTITVLKNIPIDFKAKLSLFAIIYISVFILIIIVGSFNTFHKFLPEELGISFSSKSLKEYLYRNILGLLAFSLIAVGSITWMFFRQNTLSYHEKRLSRKTKSIIKDTEHELTLLMDNDKIKTIDKAFASLDLEAISNIHKPDMNLYDLSGKLMKASDWIIFEKGIISKQMDYPAYFSLAKNKKNVYVDEYGQIGKTTYKISYKPVTYHNGPEIKTIGYLGFPYYSKKSNLDSDVYGFMGNLMTTYVLLFVLAGFFGNHIATQLTRPIKSLANKLREFRLGGTNSEIQTKRQDEVKDLIDEYNKLTVKLAEGTENLKALEKEKAFREMARSVAHDIKNPLNPMKLHIQFLQLTMDSNEEEFKMRVKKTSKTLLEQIDHIENIVSALNTVDSKTKLQKLSLSNLVEGAYQLYKPKKDIEITLTMPDQHYYISADENQMSRVLNNLLTNANQALDEYGERKIDIIVSEKDNHVIVEIKDSGCGIPKDMYDKILELNFTTKTTGSGLGLSMVRTIVEGSNGRIYFKSEIEKGTSFFIEFPIIDTEPCRFGYASRGLGA